MKKLFSIIIALFSSESPIRENISKIWNNTTYTREDLSRIIRQYLYIFNSMDIQRKEKIAIIAPNSKAWIFLLIAAMSKRFKIYIISPRESMLNIRSILVNNQIVHIFTNEDIGIKLKESGISRFTFLKSIIEIGTIYNKSLVGTSSLFYSQYYSILDSTEEDNNRIERIDLAPQFQEIDEDKMIDWANQLINETDLYEINVFSEGTTRHEPAKHTFSGETFEKIIEKVRKMTNYRHCSVHLDIDFSEWVPFAIGFFLNASTFKREKAEVSVYDNNTFLHMWREVVESKLQDPILNWFVNRFSFLMTIVAKKALLEYLGKFDDLYILNGGMLPVYIKRILVQTKLPIHTTFGTLGNGYVSFINHGKGILSDLQEPVYEKDGYVSFNIEKHYPEDNTRLFRIYSSTDSNTNSFNSLEVMYQKTTVKPKILWFKQKVIVTRRYEGRWMDVKSFSSSKPVTSLINLLRSIRLFNGVVVVATPDSKEDYKRVLIEINQREKEVLGLQREGLDKEVNSIIRNLNRYLPRELKIKCFSLVEEGSFIKTRNGNVKSFLYNK